MVFNPCSEDTLVIVGADFLLTVVGNTLSQEGGYVVWLYRKDFRPDNPVIMRFQAILLFGHDVCCAFNLLDSPCVTEAECFSDWTVAFCKSVQNLMEAFRVDPVRELLGSFNIRGLKEGVIMHTVSDSLLLQLMGKKVVAVHVEQQAERSPCGDTQIAESKLLVNEIEIIMKTFALAKFKKCLPCGLIMPWLISIALFHGRKDMNQPFGSSGLLDDSLNPVIFADEFNFNVVFICDTLGVRTDLFCKRL